MNSKPDQVSIDAAVQEIADYWHVQPGEISWTYADIEDDAILIEYVIPGTDTLAVYTGTTEA